jgi:diguanylate cyclase (GGDEF)-like protein
MMPTTAGRGRWGSAPLWRFAAARGTPPQPTGGDVAAQALTSQARVARWVLSLALLLLISILVGAVSLGQQASLRDDGREADQRVAMQAAIDGLRARLAETTMSRAMDLGAAPLLDGGELEGRLAPAAATDFAYERAYIIDRERKTIAAYPHGEPPLSAQAAAQLARLIARAADAPSNRVATDFVLIDDTPVLAAITALSRHHSGAAEPGLVLATLRRLDPSLLRLFEQRIGVKGLTFDGAPDEGRVVHSLLGEGGRMVGWLSWERDRPTMRMLETIVPVLVLIAVGVLAFAGMAVREMRKTIRDLAESQANVWRLAHEDALTGLPNHRKMLDAVERTLAERAGNQVVTFAYLDIDGFKEINDSLGHIGGDQLLAALADRLRRVAPAHATCARFGGDEFALVMTSETHEEGLTVVRAVLDAVNKPYWIDGRVVQSGGSIGLAQAPRDAGNGDELSHRADLALREAKRMGRGLLVSFVPAMDSQFEEERFFKRELQRALTENMMDVHYQAIVTADGTRVVGVEALLRWTHPTRGEIPPSIFVPIAEQTGMMDELGAFVLNRALTDARRWPDFYIAVNLSPVQVRDRRIVERVTAIMKRTQVEPGRVLLEITEGLLMENPAEAKQRLEDLRALGVRIALDDFGSGYSSFAYLQRFPFDKLKIDKGFVQSLSDSANGGVIIQAIVALGRALGVTVLVEGVETEEQRVLLRLAGCDEMQGFLFARPAPRETIDRLWADANRQGAGARHGVRATV